MTKRTKLNQLKKKFKKLPRSLAEHVFGFFMFLVFIALVLGGVLFYQYSFLTEKMEAEVLQLSIQYKENVLKEMSDQWLKREKKFMEADTKQYPNLFKEQLSEKID